MREEESRARVLFSVQFFKGECVFLFLVVCACMAAEVLESVTVPVMGRSPSEIRKTLSRGVISLFSLLKIN